MTDKYRPYRDTDAVIERVARAIEQAHKLPARRYADYAQAALASLQPGDHLGGGLVVSDAEAIASGKAIWGDARQAAEAMRERIANYVASFGDARAYDMASAIRALAALQPGDKLGGGLHVVDQDYFDIRLEIVDRQAAEDMRERAAIEVLYGKIDIDPAAARIIANNIRALEVE